MSTVPQSTLAPRYAIGAEWLASVSAPPPTPSKLPPRPVTVVTRAKRRSGSIRTLLGAGLAALVIATAIGGGLLILSGDVSDFAATADASTERPSIDPTMTATVWAAQVCRQVSAPSQALWTAMGKSTGRDDLVRLGEKMSAYAQSLASTLTSVAVPPIDGADAWAADTSSRLKGITDEIEAVVVRLHALDLDAPGVDGQLESSSAELGRLFAGLDVGAPDVAGAEAAVAPLLGALRSTECFGEGS